MRTLDEIVEAVKRGHDTESDELEYALLVYVFMFNMEHRQLREELTKEPRSAAIIREMRVNNSFEMYKKALNTNPMDYLGWDNDPQNPEYQKRLDAAYKLADKFINKAQKEREKIE